MTFILGAVLRKAFFFFPMPRSDEYSFKSSSYSRMCMCTHMCLCVGAHIYTQRLTLSIVLQSLPLFVFET